MTRQNPKFFPGNKQIFSHDPKAVIFKEKSQKKFRGFFFLALLFLLRILSKKYQLALCTKHFLMYN